jgi:hypothetical protein
MDYKEEQASELEALESIYPSEFKLLGTDPSICTVEVRSSTFDEETGEGYRCCLKFTLPPTYPEEVPEVDIVLEDDDTYSSNLEESDIEEMKRFLIEQAVENTGMAMIFTIVSAAQEWMSTRWDTRVKRAEEEAERRLAEVEEAERTKFEGTRVTVQSFIEWKIKFEAEMKAKEGDKKEDPTVGKKLTGKELFLRDKTLNESDLQFLDEEYEAVPIDESLFDVDDLDLGDDDDEED